LTTLESTGELTLTNSGLPLLAKVKQIRFTLPPKAGMNSEKNIKNNDFQTLYNRQW